MYGKKEKEEAARWSVTTLEHSAVLVHHRYRDDRRRRPAAGHFHVRQGGTQKKRTTSSNELGRGNEGGNVYSQKWADYICAEDNQVFKKKKKRNKNLCDLSPPHQMFWLCVKEFGTAGDLGLQFTLVVYIYPPPSPPTPSFFVLSRVHGNNVVR